MRDYREAPLASRDRAMLDYAVKLTREPGAMRETDLGPLRAEGFDDEAITEIALVTGTFALYNRLADGLGIDLEPEFEAHED